MIDARHKSYLCLALDGRVRNREKDAGCNRHPQMCKQIRGLCHLYRDAPKTGAFGAQVCENSGKCQKIRGKRY